MWYELYDPQGIHKLARLRNLGNQWLMRTPWTSVPLLWLFGCQKRSWLGLVEFRNMHRNRLTNLFACVYAHLTNFLSTVIPLKYYNHCLNYRNNYNHAFCVSKQWFIIFHINTSTHTNDACIAGEAIIGPSCNCQRVLPWWASGTCDEGITTGADPLSSMPKMKRDKFLTLDLHWTTLKRKIRQNQIIRSFKCLADKITVIIIIHKPQVKPS